MVEEIIEISGWKGKDEIDLQEGTDSYLVIEHRKSKETSEVYTNEHTIPKINVKVLWDLIRENCEVGKEYKYKYLVRLVINNYKIDQAENLPVEVMMESFNGGKFRAKYFFNLLYYPLKILEKKGYLVYFGRGGIMKISKEEMWQ